MSLFRPAPSAIPALTEARRRRWRRFLLALLTLIIAGFALNPVYRSAKGWRARTLAARAEQSLLEGQPHRATEELHAALQLAPRESVTIRAAARLYTKSGSPKAFSYWRALVALPSASAEDRRDAVRFGLEVQRYDLCAEQLQHLLKAEPSNPENLDLAAQLALQKNDRVAAERLTAQLLEASPTHPQARLRRGRLLLSSPESTQRKQGLGELLELGQSEAPTALAALETLSSDEGLPRDAARSVSEALSAHPGARIEHRLAAIGIQIRLDPVKKNALVGEAIQRFGTGEPGMLVALARWTIQQGEPARVPEFIPLAVALTRQDLFLARADALAALGEWKEIRRILEEDKVPLEPFHREVFLARAAMESGETAAADSHWAKALDEASRNPASLNYLAQYAGKVRALSTAEKAWRQLARQPSWALRAHAALVSIVEAKGDTRGLRDLMRQLRKTVPDDPAPRHDEAYLDLLLGENIAAALQTAEDLHRQYPSHLAYVSTVALGQFRTGDFAAARKHYDRDDIPWDKAPPGAQAIRAAVLFANGELGPARIVAGSIPVQTLKPEEQQLLEPLQRGLPKLRAQPQLQP